MERWISTFCKAKPICTLATSTYFFIPSLTQVSWLCFIQSQILRQKPSRKLFNSKQEKIFHLLHNPSQKWGIACLVSTPICLSVCKFLTERVFERGTVAKRKIERLYCVGLNPVWATKICRKYCHSFNWISIVNVIKSPIPHVHQPKISVPTF